MTEIRRPGYTIVRDDTPKMQDYSAEKLKERFKDITQDLAKFKQETKDELIKTNDKITKLTKDIDTLRKEREPKPLTFNSKPTITE